MIRPRPSPNWVSLCDPYNPAVEPGSPSVQICGEDPAPPAKSTLLRSADDTVLRAIFGGYASCGRMVDGNDLAGGRNIHRVYQPWAAGTKYARLWATRCGHASQGAVQVDTLTSDDGPADVTIAVASPVYGAELYLDTGATFGFPKFVSTGTAKLGAGEPSRLITVVEALAGSIQLLEVRNAAGFCLEPVEVSQDLGAI